MAWQVERGVDFLGSSCRRERRSEGEREGQIMEREGGRDEAKREGG